MPTRPLSRTRLLVFAAIPTLLVLLFAEAGTRLYFYAVHGETKYLTAPLGMTRRYTYKATSTYTRYDACSGRNIYTQINSEASRGPEWPSTKSPGTYRILATGGSSTFGTESPYEATWPVQLGAILRDRTRRAVEVLNAGESGQRLEHIVRELPRRVERYRPDMVLFYEGYNNVADNTVGRFHDTWGRLAYRLYYSSMLYTYLVEKIALRNRVAEESFAKEHDLFSTALRSFVDVLRRRGVAPVFVLQVYSSPPDPAVRHVDMMSRRGVEDYVARRAGARTSTWVARAEILVETMRRTGAELGVHVIDPRPALVDARPATLFCNEVHLNDRGHRALAEAIAAQLVLPPR